MMMMMARQEKMAANFRNLNGGGASFDRERPPWMMSMKEDIFLVYKSPITNCFQVQWLDFVLLVINGENMAYFEELPGCRGWPNFTIHFLVKHKSFW